MGHRSWMDSVVVRTERAELMSLRNLKVLRDIIKQVALLIAKEKTELMAKMFDVSNRNFLKRTLLLSENPD